MMNLTFTSQYNDIWKICYFLLTIEIKSTLSSFTQQCNSQ